MAESSIDALIDSRLGGDPDGSGHSAGGGGGGVDGASGALNGSSRIEDSLMRAGSSLAEKHARLREERERELSREMTFRPKLSKTAENLKRKKMPIEDRLFQYKAEREARLAEESARLNSTEGLFSPTLPAKSEELAAAYVRGRDVSERMEVWQEERLRRIAEGKEKIEKLEVAEMQSGPKINKRSAGLAGHRDPNVPIEHRLLLKGFEAEQRRKELGAQLEKEHDRAAHETDFRNQQGGTHHDSSADADEVVKRLMEYEEKRRRMLEKKRLEQEEKLQMTLTLANQSFRAPMLDAQSGLNPLTEEAMMIAEEAKQRRQEKYAMMLRKEKEIFPGRMNTRSARIAARLPTTAEERLFAPRPAFEPPAPEMEFTFHPEINEKSRRLAGENPGERHNFQKRFLDMHKRNKVYEKRKEQLKKTLEEEEMKECTFKPAVSGAGKHVYSKDKNLFERHEEWLKQRDERRRDEAAKLAVEELKECTFTPKKLAYYKEKVARQRHEKEKRASTEDGAEGNETTTATERRRRNSDSHYLCKGEDVAFEKFLNRQKMAREREFEKQQVFNIAAKWKYRVTQPEEFRFQSLNRSPTATSYAHPSHNRIFMPERLRVTSTSGYAGMGLSDLSAVTRDSDHSFSLAADSSHHRSADDSGILLNNSSSRLSEHPHEPVARPGSAQAIVTNEMLEKRKRIERFQKLKQALKIKLANTPTTPRGDDDDDHDAQSA